MINFGWVVLGLVLLYFGAEWLVKGSSELALKVGISPLIVGLTVVAFGTSAPELLVSVSANLKEPPSGDIALGNVVGSNICNLALVLGIAALVAPIRVHRQVLKREMPILLVATGVFVAMLWDGEVSRVEGVILAAGVIIYTVSSIRLGQKGGEVEVDLEVTEAELAEIRSAGAGKVVKDFGLILLGLAALAYGANRMVFGGGNLALAFGVPEAVIGLTILAFGTSLPEIATVVMASAKGEGDLVTGNAVGSCIFNLMAVIGITACISALSANELQRIDLWVMTGVTVLIFPLMWTRKTLARWEGALMVMAYLGYTFWLFVR